MLRLSGGAAADCAASHVTPTSCRRSKLGDWCAEPRLAGYFGSAAYALPQNNKSAAYGNTVDDGR